MAVHEQDGLLNDGETIVLTKALEQAAALPNTTAADSVPPQTTYTPPQKHSVMMQVGDKELWVYEMSESDLKRFIDNADPDDVVFKEYKGTVYLWLEIKPEDADYRTIYKSVQTCAYDGTEKYLKSLFGVELHFSDKDWYKNHPAVVSSGLPDGATLGVLQALVKPYGFGIAEILMRRGRGKTADTNAWKEVMGINPMSQVNNLVTDDDYLAQFGDLDPDTFATIEADVKSNRFRYVDEVRGPAVIFGAMAATSYASGGGHARYLAPRERVESFEYAIRFARLDQIQYKGDIDTLVNDFNGKYETKKELDFWPTKWKGKTMTSWTSWSNKSGNGYPNYSNSYCGGSSSKGNQPKGGDYTPPKPSPDRVPGEKSVPLHDGEALVPGFLKLCTAAGIGKAYDEDLELNPDLMNTLYDFCVEQAQILGSKIKAEWLMLPADTKNLCNKGENAKRLRREIRKFRDQIATYKEGLINFALAAERMTTDCERWILYTIAREVYL